jgi:hypothetical protein
MVMAVREEHPLKVASPIVITPSGIVMAVREEHPEKASLPIFVTESGMVMDLREEQSEKAHGGDGISLSPYILQP